MRRCTDKVFGDVCSFRLVYPISKTADEAAHPPTTLPPQIPPPPPADEPGFPADNGSTDDHASPHTSNGEGASSQHSLETLVEEGEIVESSDQQVDSARRLVERGLVL